MEGLQFVMQSLATTMTKTKFRQVIKAGSDFPVQFSKRRLIKHFLTFPVPFDYLAVVDKKIRLEGFSVYDYEHEWKDALDQVVNWILEVIQSLLFNLVLSLFLYTHIKL
jgi:hypothetical protein